MILRRKFRTLKYSTHGSGPRPQYLFHSKTIESTNRSDFTQSIEISQWPNLFLRFFAWCTPLTASPTPWSHTERTTSLRLSRSLLSRAMAKGLRSSRNKTNNSKLRSNVFGPAETARKERLSAKLIELASKPQPNPEQGTKMTDGEKGQHFLEPSPRTTDLSNSVGV